MTPKKKPEDLLKEGRKTKYKPEYCEEMMKYFDVEPLFETPVDIYDKKGNLKLSKVAFVPNNLPTFAGFAVQIGVCVDTLHEWENGRYPDDYKDEKLRGQLKHPEFSETIKRAKACQEKILVTNALRNNYNPTFSIFFAKNCLNWKDKTETDVTSNGDKVVSFTYIAPNGNKSDDNSTT